MEWTGEFNPEGANQLVAQLDRTDQHLVAFASGRPPLRDLTLARRARRKIREIKQYIVEHHWKVVCAEVTALLALLAVLVHFQGDGAALIAIVTQFGCTFAA